MQILKTNWLRAILFSILGLGISFSANAANEKGKTKEGAKTDKALTTVIFRYEAPTGVSNPYDQEHVQNTENWKPAETACGTQLNPNTPCSIVVPSANTIGGNELEIDPNLVTINTEFVSANRYMLAAPTGTQYSSPVNIALP